MVDLVLLQCGENQVVRRGETFLSSRVSEYDVAIGFYDSSRVSLLHLPSTGNPEDFPSESARALSSLENALQIYGNSPKGIVVSNLYFPTEAESLYMQCVEFLADRNLSYLLDEDKTFHMENVQYKDVVMRKDDMRVIPKSINHTYDNKDFYDLKFADVAVH